VASKSPKGYIKVKAEYELVYADKEPKASILTNTLEAPLQEVRVFNEDNEWEDGWRNMLIFGDNLLALKTLYEDIKIGGPNKYKLRNKIKLIYIDPPFATKQDFFKDKEKAYRDKVYGAKFIEFTRKRLIFLREILAEDGSIYVHLDHKKGHYIKSILDEVFGEHNFLNEIIWAYKEREMAKDQWNRKHDVIFFYKKNEKPVFNYKDVLEEYRAETAAKFKYEDEDGFYQIRGKGIQGSPINKADGLRPEHEIKYPGLTYRQYMQGGTLPRDWWQMPIVNKAATERLEYPTQKPESLLERIIKASSNPKDIILDCFAGSGTTIATAEKLNRKWIAMDCGKLAINTIQSRLLNLSSQVGTAKKDDRGSFERITNSEISDTRGMFFISEKSKKGQLELTDDFIYRLHEFLRDIKGIDEFSLVCPEEKFHLSKYEEDENGVKVFKKEHIAYKISFIEPKVKPTKNEPLKAKSFVLYNAGVYDKENILNLHWEQYKEFVTKLFEVRKSEHSIKGFKVDGYIGVHSTYIWNYPDKKKIAIDEEYVKELHNYLKGKGGERFYVIAPAQSMNFMQDEIKLGETVYTFLKVPASVLIRLIQKGELSSFKQPKSEENVNEVIDAFGFDFVSQPQLKYTLQRKKKKTGMFEEEKYMIKLTEFYSDGLLYSPEDFKNFETLSLVLIDLDYKEEPFSMDLHFWGKSLVKDETTPVEIIVDAEKWTKNKMAVILIDEYGNEKKLVLTKKDFN
jgi:DNA modification methylase